ncbi:MAG: hypothetical protein Fur006_18360 [Coleofasciculaceae cyanobacterium]
MSQKPYTYNLLSPTKKFSQLIAKSWVGGEPVPTEEQELKAFLVHHDIFSKKEAELFTIETQESGTGYINAPTFEIRFVYSQERPQEVTEPELQEWINSPENFPPWVPQNQILHNALRLWGIIYAF